jgi:hypothetical protein
MNSQTMNTHPMTTRAKSRKIITERQTRMVEYTLKTFNLFKMRIFSMISAMIMGYALFVLKMPNIVKILNVCYLTSALIIMKNVDKEYYCETDVDNQIFMWLIKNIFGKKVAIVEEEEETREEVDDEDDEEDDDDDEEEDDDDDEDYIPGEDEDPYRKRRVRKLPVTVDECVLGECDLCNEPDKFVSREYDEAEDVEDTDDEQGADKDSADEDSTNEDSADEDSVADNDSDEDYVPGEDENPYIKKKTQQVCVENIAKQTDVIEQTTSDNVNIRNLSDDYVLAEM